MVNDELSVLFEKREVLGHVDREWVSSDVKHTHDRDFTREISEIGVLDLIESKTQFINHWGQFGYD